jgi:hypothetical protein
MARKPTVYVCYIGGPYDGLEYAFRGKECQPAPVLDLGHMTRAHLYRLALERSVVDGGRFRVAVYVHVPEGVADASSSL